MIAILAAVLILAPAFQDRSLYKEIVPAPTGKNGYEEYLQAADLLTDGLFSVYLNWSPSQYKEMQEANSRLKDGEWSNTQPQLDLAKNLSKMDYLGVQEAAAKRYGRAIKLMMLGNGKPVFDPRKQISSDTMFREFSYFKSLARLVVADVYQKLANGDSSGAQQDLVAGLAFSHRISQGTIIAALVGIASEAILFSCYQEQLEHMSLRDMERASNMAAAILAEPCPIIACMQGDRDLCLSGLKLIQDHDSVQSFFGGDVNGDAVSKVWKTLGPAQRQQVISDAGARISQTFQDRIARFSGPESSWLPAESDDTPTLDAKATVTSDLLPTIFSEVLTPSFRQAIMASLRNRAQLRLLDLHARILAYRWRNRKLPSDLKEVAPDNLINDPLSGQPFRFESVDGINYDLYSMGIPETGKIQLKYRRQNVPSYGGNLPPQSSRMSP